MTKTKGLSYQEFDKCTPRKLNLHILSPKNDSLKKCVNLIKLLTNESPNNGNDLKQECIKDKIKLFSFMSYHSYNTSESLMRNISLRIEYCKKNVASGKVFFSEAVIVICNNKKEERCKQIDTIREKI